MTLTQKKNQNIIIIYVVIGFIIGIIAALADQPVLYIISFVLIGMALMRKFFLMKRLPKK